MRYDDRLESDRLTREAGELALKEAADLLIKHAKETKEKAAALKKLHKGKRNKK